MSTLPFLLLFLFNGVLVGCGAGLIARGIASGDGAIRFRDTCALGIAGALGGTTVSSLFDWGSSLVLASLGAALVLIAATLYRHTAAADLHHIRHL